MLPSKAQSQTLRTAMPFLNHICESWNWSCEGSDGIIIILDTGRETPSVIARIVRHLLFFPAWLLVLLPVKEGLGRS